MEDRETADSFIYIYIYIYIHTNKHILKHTGLVNGAVFGAREVTGGGGDPATLIKPFCLCGTDDATVEGIPLRTRMSTIVPVFGLGIP